nr:hypothetical protein [Actinospica acidithermotolerans]
MTTSAVRPGSQVRSASTISCSLRGSRCSVGSSSSTIGVSLRIARARATRRTWPPESAKAPSPSGVSSGKSIPARAAASATALSSLSGAPSRMASATVSPVSRGRCGTHATSARHFCGSSSLRSKPPTVIRPVEGRSKPRSRCSSVDLPAPLDPTNPVTRPGAGARSTAARAASGLSFRLTVTCSKRIRRSPGAARPPRARAASSSVRLNTWSATASPSAAS